MELVKYEAARKAIAEAHSVDEVKQIKDKAEAIRIYAKQSKDFDMANWAAEIRMRSERRMGEMLKEQEMNKGHKFTGGNTPRPPAIPTLSEIGITKSMSSRAQKIADIPEKDFEEIIDDYKEGGKELTSAAMTKLLKDKRKTELKEKRAVPDDLPDKTERYEIIHGEFQDIDIAPDSIDIIITDPPYPKEYIELYGELAEFSQRVLKPGGLLVAMCGHSYLPQILPDMARHIDYLWMSAYLLLGGQSVQVFPRKVNTFWKPLLMFSKGKYTGDWYGDVCKSDANDKDHHHWGQSESGMMDIVGRFSLPHQTILDPFCGAGTTGVAALRLGRNFIGIEIESKFIDTTRERLNEC